ncbi:helix-turn-helix domain-containing protein [Polaribacter porphyrae]|uniref:HTH cro/C1-type domain-containing protein n=1 Tax=Polaribacter porphyrae TaxID=1137780 RepID=A0A2S7WQ81_9FLAO|nr:helix-turn-helix transcriptional regulator [Polaribacter porphyrae]PQJ79472.1 hypothetical protein BTO18_09945 [Polaribacter porphyrae]
MKRKNIYHFLVEDDLITILKKIKTIRLEQNLTQADMCYRLNISQSVYSKLEKGESKLDMERLLLILKTLNTSLADFFKDFNSKVE